LPQKRGFQLSPQNYENEKKNIFEIGRVHGYLANQIQKIIRKHEDTTSRRNLTTLSPIEARKGKRILILFYPKFSSEMIIKWYVRSSSQYKLKRSLDQRKIRIYEIQCGTRNFSSVAHHIKIKLRGGRRLCVT
jgi:hypothetical protein